jgi:hypothetical protein
MQPTRDDLTIDISLHILIISMVICTNSVQLEDFNERLESATCHIEQPKSTAQNISNMLVPGSLLSWSVLLLL